MRLTKEEKEKVKGVVSALFGEFEPGDVVFSKKEDLHFEYLVLGYIEGGRYRLAPFGGGGYLSNISLNERKEMAKHGWSTINLSGNELRLKRRK